jgi:hypothetical protein
MDRRKNSRFTCGGEARVSSVGAHPIIEWSARVRDFSRQGISLAVERRFEARTLLIVNWQPKGEAEPQYLVSRVVRVAPRENRKWLLGCTFLQEMPFEDLAELMVCIRSPKRFLAHFSRAKTDERMQAKAKQTKVMARLAAKDSLVALDDEMLDFSESATNERSRRQVDSFLRPIAGIYDIGSLEGQPIRTSAVVPKQPEFASLAPSTPVTMFANSVPSQQENGVVIPNKENSSVSLLQKFVAMHNDMLDQFQQAIVYMVHVFERTHREQMTDIHEELKKLREVNRELQELRTHLTAVDLPASSVSVGVPVEATSENAELDVTLVEMEKAAATFSDQEWDGVIEDACLAAADPHAARNCSIAKHISPRVESSPLSSATASRSENATAPDSAKPANNRCSLANTPAPDLNGLHARLCQRMTTLQQERQSRWRKILGMLNSAGHEG